MCVHTLCQMHLCLRLCLHACVLLGGVLLLLLYECPCVCVCVCVCVGVPVCYIFYSFVRLKRACWTLVAVRIEPGPLVERRRTLSQRMGKGMVVQGVQGFRRSHTLSRRMQ